MTPASARRPSPALAVSILALVVAVAGTAVAGPGKLNKREKKQTRNIAAKQVKKLAAGLSVGSAKSADTAGSASTSAFATGAGFATNAGTAASATNATNATNATSADEAVESDRVDEADVILLDTTLASDGIKIAAHNLFGAIVRLSCTAGVGELELESDATAAGLQPAFVEYVETSAGGTQHAVEDSNLIDGQSLDMNGGFQRVAGTFVFHAKGEASGNATVISGQYQMSDCLLSGFAVAQGGPPRGE